MPDSITIQPTNNYAADTSLNSIADKISSTKLDNVTTAQLNRIDTAQVAVGTQAFDSTTNTTYELVNNSGTRSWKQLSNSGLNALSGFTLTWSSVSALSIGAGLIQVGDLLVSLTTATTLNTPSLSASTWYYVYISTAGAVSYSASEPNKSDVSGNSAGDLLYYTTGGIWYRCIGCFYSNASSEIEKFYQQGNYIEFDAYPTIKSGLQSTIEAETCIMPAISDIGVFRLFHKVGTSSGLNWAELYRDNGTTLMAKVYDLSNTVGVTWLSIVTFRTISRTVYYITKNQAVGSGGEISLKQVGFYINVR